MCNRERVLMICVLNGYCKLPFKHIDIEYIASKEDLLAQRLMVMAPLFDRSDSAEESKEILTNRDLQKGNGL